MLGTIPRQKITSLEAFCEQAEATFEPFVAEMESFVEDSRQADPEKFGELAFHHSGLKTREKIRTNLFGKYEGDVTRILDAVRGSLVVPGMYVDDLVAAMDERFARAGDIQDRISWPNKFGYRDRQFFIVMPNGHICEVQCVSSEIAALRKETHRHRESANEIERRAIKEGRLITLEEQREFKLFMKRCLGLHNAAAISSGLNEKLAPDLPEERRVNLVISAFPVVDFAEVAPRGDNPEPVYVVDLEEGALDWLPEFSKN
ncbi:MAG: hypothetical protein KDI65_02480 [Alphaproteobacteria bacterium]|nr:hypothetical protein [Alphaproteobacteria bacterium]